ncbi:MAG: DUF3500 domain-containing protein [Planctomycetes bacterium]|nr:DUF3500 domain-containing protein [Planctomycetota bacterium]
MSVTTRSPDWDSDHGHITRRGFLRTTAAGIAAASAGVVTATVLAVEKNVERASSEKLVKQLYDSLESGQKATCCFRFDDPSRLKVDANWHISEARVGKSFRKDQQELIRQIFLGLHSEEYAQQVLGQVEHDGGFDQCAIALFGEPGTGQFEFVLTGRHVTRRCDGDSVSGAAFGGPIFYGHAAKAFNEPPDHEGNVYWFQALRANELFQALDGKQRERALLGDSRGEQGTDTVKLRGTAEGLAGIPVSELSADQRKLAEKVMEDLLRPFREADRLESMNLIRKNGFDQLHFSFYKNEDIGDDGVWDVWQVEGPTTLWYFNGQPHVHTWVHIRESV